MASIILTVILASLGRFRYKLPPSHRLFLQAVAINEGLFSFERNLKFFGECRN